jgi:hypothetical protein
MTDGRPTDGRPPARRQGHASHGTGGTAMPETIIAPEVEVKLTPGEVEVRFMPDEVELVRTALRMLRSALGRDEADELAEVKALLRKLDAPA